MQVDFSQSVYHLWKQFRRFGRDGGAPDPLQAPPTGAPGAIGGHDRLQLKVQCLSHPVCCNVAAGTVPINKFNFVLLADRQILCVQTLLCCQYFAQARYKQPAGCATAYICSVDAPCTAQCCSLHLSAQPAAQDTDHNTLSAGATCPNINRLAMGFCLCSAVCYLLSI